MNALELMNMQMASVNPDIAISLLQESLSASDVSREKESKLNTLTMYISNAVQGSQASIQQIKQKIIPLFKQVYKQLTDQHYQENIQLRLINLRRYTRGLSSILPEKYIPKEAKKQLSPEMIKKLAN